MFGEKILSFSQLLDLTGKGQYVGVRNTAGFANQTRCILSVLATGNVPILIRDDDYMSKISKSHGCDLSKIYKYLEVTDRKKNLPVYSDITLPPPDCSSDKSHLFNLLNMWGMINISSLPFYKNELCCYRKYFLSLGPMVEFNELPSAERSSSLVLHIRDFSQETQGWHFDSRIFNKIKIPPYRHIQKVDKWTPAREEHLLFSLKNIVPLEVTEVQIVTGDVNEDFLKRVRDRFHSNNIATFVRRSSSESAELEDLLIISNSRYLVLSSLSTFGHLGALLNERLSSCVTV
jgi:hypothetical protein